MERVVLSRRLVGAQRVEEAALEVVAAHNPHRDLRGSKKVRAAAREELAAAFVALRTLALRIDLRLTDPAPGVPLLHLQVAAAQLWSHVAGQARGGQKWPLAHLA